MTDKDRWQFLLAGFVEVTHIYDTDGIMIGMSLETDTEVIDCFNPDDVNSTIDRLIYTSSHLASIH